MDTVFSKIIRGEIPSYTIAEDENFFAFLDINPIALGHTLIVPKQRTDYIFDLDEDTLGGIMLFSKRVAAAIKAYTQCNRVAVAVIGLEVPHAHIHLVPINEESDLDFKGPRLTLTKDEFVQTAQGITKHLI